MARARDEDGYTQLDPLLWSADIVNSPWRSGRYVPDMDLLRELLSVPISKGEKQESGSVAKAFNAWIANELRRAGFPPGGVWPRTRRPRVLPDDLAALESDLEKLEAVLAEVESDGARLGPPALRKAIRALASKLPNTSEAYILGDFYSKQIDVTIASWRRGPDAMISTKTMFSAYRKNLKNRHEEAVGEVVSLRARHPMAAMGYAYLVRRNMFEEDGAYAILLDILSRLRRPGQMFDATMLLVADWEETDSSPRVTNIDQPTDELGAARFFQDMIGAVCERSPIKEHKEVRRRCAPEPMGGLPGETDEELGDADE
jgi:hypothetical protein